MPERDVTCKQRHVSCLSLLLNSVMCSHLTSSKGMKLNECFKQSCGGILLEKTLVRFTVGMRGAHIL